MKDSDSGVNITAWIEERLRHQKRSLSLACFLVGLMIEVSVMFVNRWLQTFSELTFVYPFKKTEGQVRHPAVQEVNARDQENHTLLKNLNTANEFQAIPNGDKMTKFADLRTNNWCGWTEDDNMNNKKKIVFLIYTYLLHIVIVRMTGTFLRKPAGGSGWSVYCEGSESTGCPGVAASQRHTKL